MLDYYAKALNSKKSQNLYRSLQQFEAVSSIKIKKNNRLLTSFCSNDYLGLAQHKDVIEASATATIKYGAGASASRFISGNNVLYLQLEKSIAQMHNCDDAIVFSSGYSCAVGIMPALVEKGDLVIADRLSHSCLLDGSKLSQARLIRFLHNDSGHCRQILEQNRNKYNKCLIITEAIFSMDGDLGKIKQLLRFVDEFNAVLVADYAHDFGATPFVENHPRLLKMGTLSKSIGALGGYVAGNKNIIDYLRNFSKSLIYSTALPPAILAGAIKAIQLMQDGKLAAKALENAQYFCNLLNLPEAQSAIVPIIISNNTKLLHITQRLEDEGFLVSAIRPPTVEKNKSRLRITFSAMHDKKDIKSLAKILQNCL